MRKALTRVLVGTIVTLIVGVCGCAVAAAQANLPDWQKFEGKWILDREKSSENAGGPEQDEVLQITYTEPQLRIEKSQTRKNETRSATLVLFTDKRGELNKPFPFEAQREIRSTTIYEKEELIRNYTMENVAKGGRPQEIPAREVYRLSKDGMTLTIVDDMLVPPEMNMFSARRQIMSKRVYRRGK
jgi:hypothetical protein